MRTKQKRSQKRNQEKRMGRPPKYPWDKWFSRNRFTLEKGKHFDCHLHSMIVQVRRAAVKRRIKVKVEVRDESKLSVRVI